jgi:hypothetical protein
MTFELSEFLDWVRDMPSDEEYDFINSNSCPIAQFLIATGLAQIPVVFPSPFEKTSEWYDDAIPLKRGKKPLIHRYPRKASEAARALGKLATFGHLVQRLEELMAK